jgi:carboxymethylenebutenolidase
MADLIREELELGHLARPATGSRGGVVVIHDVWGLYDHYRDLARRLADAGWAALAVNLYRREPEVKITDPGRWIRALDDRRVLADVQEAIDFLAAHPSVGGGRVGVMGCCMGGQYTILAAAGCRGLAAAVPYYGMLSDAHGLLAPTAGETLDRARKPRSPLDAASDLRCPTLAFFGAEDAFIPQDDVRAFEAKLAPEHRVVVYPGAGHAFLNDTRAEMYRPDAARDAWSRTLDWFATHLIVRS